MTVHERSTQPLSRAPAVVPEPFGQTGVRQYFFRALWTASFIAMVFCIAFWLRSIWFTDQVTIAGGRQVLAIRSLAGRLVITSTTFRSPIGESMHGITYESRSVPPQIGDGWKPSIWKTVGLEMRNEPFQMRVAVTDGSWLRAKWPTLTLLSAVLPAIKGTMSLASIIRRRTRAPM